MRRQYQFIDLMEQPPIIHVCQFKPFELLSTEELVPWSTDKIYRKKPYSGRHESGSGTATDPFTYPHGAPVSPHYEICDLWFKHRRSHASVYILVNDWLLRVSGNGVTSIDGTFTQMLNEKTMTRRLPDDWNE